MAIMGRAINDEQKEERRKTILNTAAELFLRKNYHSISVAEIARETGIAKGTVFLYFRTKEEIFLTLQMQAYAGWFDAVNRELMESKRAGQVYQIDEFVGLIRNSFNQHNMLIQIIPILHIILEQNIKYDVALKFKQFIHRHLEITGALFEGCLPFLKKNDGFLLLLNIQALVIGLMHMAEPSDVVKAVISQSGMEMFIIDFEEFFINVFRKLLIGIKYQNSE